MMRILKSNISKVISLVLCTILPIAFSVVILCDTFDNAFSDFFIKNIYNLLWCGLYGCGLTCIIFETKLIKIMVIIANLLPFVFLAFGSLMGGILGPFILILKAIIPFIPL